MDDSSQFIDTKKKISKGNRFSASKRNVFVSKSFTPGPGSYQASSAFGHYMERNAAMSALSMNQNPVVRATLTSADRGTRSTRNNNDRLDKNLTEQILQTNRSRFKGTSVQINSAGLKTTAGGIYGSQTYQNILTSGYQ
jgi:hypothetical protein